jgi:hypothetical protein
MDNTAMQIRDGNFGARDYRGARIENRNSQRRRVLRESGETAKKHG